VRRPRKKLRTIRRYYAWIDGQAWRLTHDLHTKFVAGEISLTRFANKHLRIIGIMAARRVGREPILQVTGSTYILDDKGNLDLSDQVEAVQDIHNWDPPPAAVRQVEADIFPETRTGDFKSAPVLKASSSDS
jgi:hypothetical protein